MECRVRQEVHPLTIQTRTKTAEAWAKTAQVKVMSDHVAKSPTPSMLCEGVLMLTFRHTHMVLNAQVAQELFEVVGGRFTRSVRIEDAKALRTLALFQVVIDSFGVDAVLVAAFDGAANAADWIVQRVDVHYELLHDCRQVGVFGQNVVPACAGAPIDEEGVVPWVVRVGEEVEVYFKRSRLLTRGRWGVLLSHMCSCAAMAGRKLSGAAGVQERLGQLGRTGKFRVLGHELAHVVVRDSSSEDGMQELEPSGPTFRESRGCGALGRSSLF